MSLKQDYQQKLEQLNNLLNTDVGIISQIEGAHYTVAQTFSYINTIQSGNQYLIQETYCKEVIAQQKLISYAHVGRIRSMVLHPIYTAMQLEAYIGLPILSPEGEVFGTLNFSGLMPKPNGFSEEEIALVTELRDEIEQSLAERDYSSDKG
ncbi:GAF domain-containing protein [Reinekea marina]|uniref:GAF domain-containing protein n=1 Tax=Reinekea marina TaxID=1310421 RepID=A0ABV7WRU6_9GAMM|nr:GAF domain-containing protein [Reinekea marina]MDN3648090.1 GAF domain-containing protein [Reinekea marina]